MPHLLDSSVQSTALPNLTQAIELLSAPEEVKAIRSLNVMPPIGGSDSNSPLTAIMPSVTQMIELLETNRNDCGTY